MNRPTHPALPWRSPLPRARLTVTHTARTYSLFVLALTGVGFALRLALLAGLLGQRDGGKKGRGADAGDQGLNSHWV